MINVITVSDIKKLIQQIGLHHFFQLLMNEIEQSYLRWNEFEKSPRHATHVPNGVIELMPICDAKYYAFKYVNGHPINASRNKLTVVAVGLLADAMNGYPLLLSEMTVLTALRTAATSALAAKYLAKKSSKIVGIIGTGAQSEFQILAQHALFHLKSVRYFDTDSAAMKKFEKNLKDQPFDLIACKNGESVLEACDIVTTATAAKSQTKILNNEWIHDGLNINGIGGDCPGKTELDKAILSRAKVVVEYFPQSKIEGEIQQNNASFYAELWEIISRKKLGRENDQEITLFDSVGFAIEDYAALKLIYELSEKYKMGKKMDLIPELGNVKNLFEVLC